MSPHIRWFPVLPVLLVGCTPVTDLELLQIESLEFVADEIPAGFPLLVAARGPGTPGLSPERVTFRSPSGQTVETQLVAQRNCPRELTPQQAATRASIWSECSDEALAFQIHGPGDGVAFISFKEAGASASKIDGQVVVSDETYEAMKEWVVSVGIEIRPLHPPELEHEAPWVVVNMPMDMDVLRWVRSHPNVEFVEPNGPVNFQGGGQLVGGGTTVAAAGGLEDGALVVAPGDLVTVEHQRRDGALVTATARIR